MLFYLKYICIIILPFQIGKNIERDPTMPFWRYPPILSCTNNTGTASINKEMYWDNIDRPPEFKTKL